MKMIHQVNNLVVILGIILLLLFKESSGGGYSDSDTLVLTWTSLNDIHAYDTALSTVRSYAELHGYDRVVNTSQYDFGVDPLGLCSDTQEKVEEEMPSEDILEQQKRCRQRAGFWFKVHVLRDICMHSHSAYKRILVLDADVAINRPELSLDYFTLRHTQKQQQQQSDATDVAVVASFMGARVNSGAFMIAGGEDCLAFTQLWLAQYGWYADDNGAFNHALLAFRNPQYDGRCAVLVKKMGMTDAKWAGLGGAHPASAGTPKQRTFAAVDDCLMTGYNLTFGRDSHTCECHDTLVGEAVLLLCPHSSELGTGLQAEGLAIARSRGRQCLDSIEIENDSGDSVLARPTCDATNSFAVHSKQLKGCRQIQNCIRQICPPLKQQRLQQEQGLEQKQDLTQLAKPVTRDLLLSSQSNTTLASSVSASASASVPLMVVPISYTEWHVCRLYDESLDARGRGRHLHHIGRFVFGEFSTQVGFGETASESHTSSTSFSASSPYYLPVEFAIGKRGRNFNIEHSRSLMHMLAARPQELSLEEYHSFLQDEGWKDLIKPCLQQEIPVYYWNSKKGGGWSLTNFGDAVNVDIARGLLADRSTVTDTQQPITTSKGKLRPHSTGRPEQKLLMAGSVLLNANPGDIVWGTGLQFDTNSTYAFPYSGGLDIRATRGPLSASVLGDISAESHPHLAFGDPALLLPLFIHPAEMITAKSDLSTGVISEETETVSMSKANNQANVNKERYYCVVPHYVDIEGVKLTPRQRKIAASMPGRLTFPINKAMREYQNAFPIGTGRDGQPLRLRILSPGLSTKAMVAAMTMQCELVLSSSLHGVIFAEMYQIPARWLFNPTLLLSSRVESSLKYNDYFLSTRRSCYQHATSLTDGLAVGGYQPVSPQRWAALAQQLLITFPHERICSSGSSSGSSGSNTNNKMNDKKATALTTAVSLPDFNTYSHQSSFIRSIKQLSIPGFPDAFNPSVVTYQNHLLLSFRTRRRVAYGPITPDANTLGLVYMDNTRSFAVAPMNTASVLEFKNPHGKPGKTTSSRAHDPRLVVDPATGDLQVIYSNLYGLADPKTDSELLSKKKQKKPAMIQTRRMFISKIGFAMNSSSGVVEPLLDPDLEEPLVVTRFEGSSLPLEQKNWSPFIYNGEMLFVQSIEPHRVLILTHHSLTELTAPSVSQYLTGDQQKLGWTWGELRGGTPAVQMPSSSLLIDSDTPSQSQSPDYISFFHSSQMMKSIHSNGTLMQHYFMGAYTFESKPPFRITRISREPIFAPGMYDPSRTGLKYKTYKPIRCVFPVGLLIEEQEEKQEVNIETKSTATATTVAVAHVTFGKQDFESWVLSLCLNQLLKDNLRAVV